MADTGDVIVKANLAIPQSAPLLANYMDFVWDCLNLQPGNPNYINTHGDGAVDSSFMFSWSDTPVTRVKVTFEKEAGVDNFIFDYPQLPHLAGLYGMYPPAQYKHVSALKVNKTSVTNMLISAQNREYLCYKFIVVIHQIGKLFTTSISARVEEFFQRYWDRFTLITLRHAIKVGAYDIAWHRDSAVFEFSQGYPEANLFGTHRRAGFITSGIYVNRPQGLPPDQAGVAFLKENKIHKIFPRGGTCVTFLDPSVFHRVIPLTNPGTAEMHGDDYVKRSAVFMEHFTSRERIALSGLDQPIFSKASIPAKFRNLNAVYQYLNGYFTNFAARAHVPLNALRNAIQQAPAHLINHAYHYQPEGYPAYVASITPGVVVPPADFFVYKIHGPASNQRGRLLDLHNLYTNLKKSFSGGHINSQNFVNYLNMNMT